MRDSKNLGVDNVEVVIDFNGVATSSTINKAVLDDVLSISNDDGDGNTYFSSDRGGGHSTIEGDDTSVGGHSARSVDPLGVKNLSQNVVRSKALVLLFLTLAAAMSGIATYRFTSHSERSDFHSQVRSHKSRLHSAILHLQALLTHTCSLTHFTNPLILSKLEDYASEIIEVSQITAKQIFATTNAMSITTTSYALDQKLTWPYVTIPHFGQRGDQILELSGALFLALSPLVPKNQLIDWESYSIKNQGWIDPTYDEDVDANKYNSTESLITPYVFQWNTSNVRVTEDNAAGDEDIEYYAPIWQIAKINPSLVNMDLFTWNPAGDQDGISNPFLIDLYPEILQTRSMAMSKLRLYNNPNPNVENTWPYMFLAVPVFDKFNNVNSHTNEEEGEVDKPNIVALYNSMIPLHTVFVNVLPDGGEGSSGIVVVVKNTCSQTVSYEIQGSSVSFLGNGDLHDLNYNHLEITAKFDVLGGEREGPGYEDDDGSSSTTASTSSNRCDYTLHVYPSKAFHDSFVTIRPMLYTTFVVVIFIVTSLAFVLYDWFVQTRQRQIKAKAERSTALVSSLFPAQVRSRLMDDSNHGKGIPTVEGFDTLLPTIGGGLVNGGKTPASDLEQTGEKNSMKSSMNLMDGPAPGINYSKPIADLFESASVMFAGM